MRQFSSYDSPNYENHLDERLLTHGAPDLVLLAKGRKLYVHAEKMNAYSPVIWEQVKTPDPIWGKMIRLKDRSVAGVKALLNAIYPPQRVPPPEAFDEVYALAKELKMDLLIQKLKLGIIKSCCLEPLLNAQRVGKDPDVVFDAFAEFAIEDFKTLNKFDMLDSSTKLEVYRRRAEILEKLIKTTKPMQHVYENEKLRMFRECLEPCDEEEIDLFMTSGPSRSSFDRSGPRMNKQATQSSFLSANISNNNPLSPLSSSPRRHQPRSLITLSASSTRAGVGMVPSPVLEKDKKKIPPMVRDRMRRQQFRICYAPRRGSTRGDVLMNAHPHVSEMAIQPESAGATAALKSRITLKDVERSTQRPTRYSNNYHRRRSTVPRDDISIGASQDDFDTDSGVVWLDAVDRVSPQNITFHTTDRLVKN